MSRKVTVTIKDLASVLRGMEQITLTERISGITTFGNKNLTLSVEETGVDQEPISEAAQAEIAANAAARAAAAAAPDTSLADEQAAHTATKTAHAAEIEKLQAEVAASWEFFRACLKSIGGTLEFADGKFTGRIILPSTAEVTPPQPEVAPAQQTDPGTPPAPFVQGLEITLAPGEELPALSAEAVASAPAYKFIVADAPSEAAA